jgi:lipooligosaccharide transport system ATP-binding protein
LSLALSCKAVSKSFKGIPALKDIHLEVNTGECFGLLGPNGAGKSTLMKMIYGLNKPDSGDVFVQGLNVRSDMHEIKTRIGVVPQDDGMDTDFNALENLKLFAMYMGLSAEESSASIELLVSELKLQDHQFKRIEALSGGLRRRVAIARSLLHRPNFLVLDEPTTGLDPQARLWLWSYFRQLKKNESTILLTTHYMEEAEALCDRIAIIDHGVILDCDETTKLIRKHAGDEVIEIDIDSEKKSEKSYWIQKIREMNLNYQDFETKIFIFFRDLKSRQDFSGLIQSTHYTTRKANLNDVFLRLAGYQIRDNA